MAGATAAVGRGGGGDGGGGGGVAVEVTQAPDESASNPETGASNRATQVRGG